MRKLSLDGIVEDGEPVRVQARDVLIQRIDEHRKRQIVLELRRRPGQNQLPARPGASRELSQQPGLADPRFARHLDGARAASIQLGEHPLEQTQLVGPPHQVPGKQGDTSLRARSGRTGGPLRPAAADIPSPPFIEIRPMNPGAGAERPGNAGPKVPQSRSPTARAAG